MSITVTYPTAAELGLPLPVGTPSGEIVYADSDIDNLPTITYYNSLELDNALEIKGQNDLAFDIIKFIRAIRNFDYTSTAPADSLDNYITVAKGAKFNIKITDGCCEGEEQIIFEGSADTDTVNFCSDECTANFTLLDSSEKGNIIRCLNSRTFRENAVRRIMYDEASKLNKLTGDCTNGGSCTDITPIVHCINTKPNLIQILFGAVWFLLQFAFTTIYIILSAIIIVISIVVTLIGLLGALIGLIDISALLAALVSLGNIPGDILNSVRGFFTFCRLKNAPVAIRVGHYLNTMCAVCGIDGGYLNSFPQNEKGAYGAIDNFHITRHSRENRNLQDSVKAFENNTVSVNSVDDVIFKDFLKKLETSFSHQTRLVKNALGEFQLQLAPKRGYQQWNTSNYLDLEVDSYGGTTPSDNRYEEIVYCLDAKDEAFKAGYTLEYLEDSDEQVGKAAAPLYYTDNNLWGSAANNFLEDAEFKGLDSIVIPYAPVATSEMDASITLFGSDAFNTLNTLNITNLFTPEVLFNDAIVTSKDSFNEAKLVYLDLNSEEVPDFDTVDSLYYSNVVNNNELLVKNIKYNTYTKYSLFNDTDTTNPASYLNLLNEIGGTLDPFSQDELIYETLGEISTYFSLEDNPLCEQPLYTGSIIIKQSTCNIIQFYKELLLNPNLVMIDFNDIGQFSLNKVELNFQERTITLQGLIYASRVLI